MDTFLLAVLLVVGAIAVVLQVLILQRLSRKDTVAPELERLERGLRDELGRVRGDTATDARAIRDTLDNRLLELQRDNAEKLERIRRTVDEQLQGTLERRLRESFDSVSALGAKGRLAVTSKPPP